MVYGSLNLLTLGSENGSLLAMATSQVTALTHILFLSAHNWQAMVPGGTSNEVTQLNIESLWSGGSFSDPVCLVSI
jgi:hypothetical protein